MVSRLNNGILFRMKATAEFVPFPGRDTLFLTEAANVQAVFQPRGSPVVTRCQNLFIFDEKSTHLPPDTGGAFGNEMGDIHEILFPRGPIGMNLFFLFLFQRGAINKDGNN
jgi:hypothetical protein